MSNNKRPRSLPMENRAVSYIIAILLVLSLMTVSDAGIARSILNKVYSILGYESCEHQYLQKDGVKRFNKALRQNLFGQPLAIDMMVTALKAHLEDPDPPQGLVLSLHGGAGSGKTFTSEFLANALYEKGMKSSLVIFFMASYHFPDPEKVDEYKVLLRKNMEDSVKLCDQALFIFDEVDRIPPGVLDALVPYIRHPGPTLNGHSYKKSIFLFSSNVGANNITEITKHARKKRDKLTFKDFEHELSHEAFNSDAAGGLYKSKIIDQGLIDFYVPFLPLERQHVLSCIKVVLKRNKFSQDGIDGEAENIANLMTFISTDTNFKYSATGCKRVDRLVKFRMAQNRPRDGEDDDEENYVERDDEELKTEL